MYEQHTTQFAYLLDLGLSRAAGKFLVLVWSECRVDSSQLAHMFYCSSTHLLMSPSDMLHMSWIVVNLRKLFFF